MKVLPAIIFLLLHCNAEAQRLAERNFIYNPLAEHDSTLAEGELRWMNALHGWGGFGHYSIRANAEHEWYQLLGAAVELARFGNDGSLAFVSSIEFIAGPDNDINFDPRAVYWEEGVVYTGRTGERFFQIGYYHRCKHDIDNLIYGTERALIYGSLTGKYILPLTLFAPQDAIVALRTDVYTLRLDDRTPETQPLEEPTFNQLQASFGVTVNVRFALPLRQLGAYATAFGSIALFGANEGFLNRFDEVRALEASGGIEAGITIEGRIDFRLGVKYEHIADTGIPAQPQSADLVSIGALILAPPVLR